MNNLGAVTSENQQEKCRKTESRNTAVTRINRDYNTPVSEDLEGRLTKKLSQEFSRIESRILDALFNLYESCFNPQVRVQSVNVRGNSVTSNGQN